MTQAKSGLSTPNSGDLGIFNEAFINIFRFFIIDNWVYSICIIVCSIVAYLITRKCDVAEGIIEDRNTSNLDKVLQKISLQVKGSCSSTLWGLLVAVLMMLMPTLLKAGDDQATQAYISVLGFIPGLLIGAIQLYSAYKIIGYVLLKLRQQD